MGRKDNIAGDGRRELQNGITTLFLIYMGAAYPLIMHDKYFDITVTKYRAFYIALCIYAVLMVLAVLVGFSVGQVFHLHEKTTRFFVWLVAFGNLCLTRWGWG